MLHDIPPRARFSGRAGAAGPLALAAALLGSGCSAAHPPNAAAGPATSRPAGSPAPATSSTPGSGATRRGGIWSGYASRAGGFTSVTSSWTAPRMTCGSGRSHGAVWVGIGGYGDKGLKQTGIDFDCVDGAVRYGAWYEIDPANNPPVHWNVPVAAGDQLDGSITRNPNGGFTLRLVDRGKWRQQFSSTDASRSTLSAEVIFEPVPGQPAPRISRLAFTHTRANGKPLASFTPDLLATGGYIATRFPPVGDSFAIVADRIAG